MTARITRGLISPILALTVLSICSTAFAQGTATGPFTNHTIDPGPIVVIGDPVNPIPIDLDITGPPWSKSIDDPNGVITSSGPLDMVEYILNAGNEPWYDWHEHILAPPAGLPQSTWVSVTGLFVNGNPIGFNATGLGTPNLWLDTFSQPVLPGDILLIEKTLEVFPGTSPNGQGLLRLQEYPTPEPASAVLIGLGSLMLLRRKCNA